MLAFFNSLKGEYIQNPIKKCEYLMIQHTLWYSLKKKHTLWYVVFTNNNDIYKHYFSLIQ